MQRSLLALAVAAVVLSSLALAADAKKRQPGGKPLFNGKDFTGWQNASGGAPGKGWTVEEGAMVLGKEGGDIWTKDRYGDFVLDVEFKTEGNSGIFIRTDKPTDNVQTGIEIQVYTPGQASKHSCGAVYDALAPTKDVVKANEWNRAVITAVGSKLSVVLNGEKIVDMDLDQWTAAGKNPDGTPNKFTTALKDFKREGHIGLQDHGAKVSYRNLKVRRPAAATK
jgi:opacity protein-like surface antigen